MESEQLEQELSKDYKNQQNMAIEEKPALLSVHEGLDGQYIIRVNDVRHRSLVGSVAKLLTGARNVVLITPNDIKVFDVSGNGAEPPVESPTDGSEVQIDEETLAEIARQERIATPNAEPEVVGETPQGTKVVRRKRNLDGRATAQDEKCGRCAGEGQIQTLMDGGKPATATCPVCQGTGLLKRFGNRR